MEKKKINNKKLFLVIGRLLEVSASKITSKTSTENLDEFDSLGILNIATYFEKKTNNKKLKYDIKDFSSIKNIIKFLEKNNIKI